MNLKEELKEKGVITTLDRDGLEWYYILKDNDIIVQKVIDRKNGNTKYYYTLSNKSSGGEWGKETGY
jgi:hypothetical protein